MLKKNATKQVMVIALGAVFVTLFSHNAHAEVLDTQAKSPGDKPAASNATQEVEAPIELKPLRSLRFVLPQELAPKPEFKSTRQTPRATDPKSFREAQARLSEELATQAVESGGVEPWNPETSSVNRCARFVEVKSAGVPRRSPQFLAAFADCNELILELLREESLRTQTCDAELTRMLHGQLLVSKDGDAQLLLNVRDSEAARIGMQCLGVAR